MERRVLVQGTMSPRLIIVGGNNPTKTVRPTVPLVVPCCDIADGHRTTWKGDKTGRYWVSINDEWVQVPEEAIVYDAGNPVGEAVVWYTNFSNSIFIRCFVPGDGV